MTHVTCSLTAKNRDQLQNPILDNRVWATFTFLLWAAVLMPNLPWTLNKLPFSYSATYKRNIQYNTILFFSCWNIQYKTILLFSRFCIILIFWYYLVIYFLFFNYYIRSIMASFKSWLSFYKLSDRNTFLWNKTNQTYSYLKVNIFKWIWQMNGLKYNGFICLMLLYLFDRCGLWVIWNCIFWRRCTNIAFYNVWQAW